MWKKSNFRCCSLHKGVVLSRLAVLDCLIRGVFFHHCAVAFENHAFVYDEGRRLYLAYKLGRAPELDTDSCFQGAFYRAGYYGAPCLDVPLNEAAVSNDKGPCGRYLSLEASVYPYGLFKGQLPLYGHALSYEARYLPDLFLLFLILAKHSGLLYKAQP